MNNPESTYYVLFIHLYKMYSCILLRENLQFNKVLYCLDNMYSYKGPPTPILRPSSGELIKMQNNNKKKCDDNNH